MEDIKLDEKLPKNDKFSWFNEIKKNQNHELGCFLSKKAPRGGLEPPTHRMIQDNRSNHNNHITTAH